MMKKILCLALVLSLTVLMTGCAGKGGEELTPVETLAPATVPYEAPDGDRVTRSQADYQVFFPEKNGQKLTVGSIHLDAADLKETATALVRNVLAEINENGALRTDRELETVREIPVEISGGICTVNLSSSALQLSYSDYYRLSLALSSTLCSLEEIRYVNVLTSGQSVALDSAGRLPMGSLVSHADENLSVLWEQMEARRTPQGGDPARTALNTQATVYYPLTEGRGIACESLRITFEGQTASKLSSALLDAMSATVRNRIESANVPDLWEYMVHEPVTSEMEEGGRLITLSFREDLQELADAWKTDIACLAAAVTMTLTTFVPGTAAVCFRIGDKPVTDLDNSRFRIGTILGGLMRRNVFETFLTGSTEVYFVKDGKLIRTEKPVARDAGDSPRAQLAALMEGPDSVDREKGIYSPLPEGVREDDVLGISAEGDTLVVNFTGRFRDGIREQGPETEMLLCYAIVNTLCGNSGMKKVCFFFEGEQAEEIAGEIYWAGEFMFNPDV
jgi:hypothetical protein